MASFNADMLCPVMALVMLPNLETGLRAMTATVTEISHLAVEMILRFVLVTGAATFSETSAREGSQHGEEICFTPVMYVLQPHGLSYSPHKRHA